MHVSEATTNGNGKLADLRKRQEEIQKRIEKEEARVNAQARKKRTQYLIVFAATILADLDHHPEIGAGLEESLKRGAGDRERKILRAFGWRL
jgi:hypothetical protein